MRVRNWLLILLLAAGFWQLGSGAWIHVKAWLADKLIAYAWEKTSRVGSAMPPWPWADTRPIARLEVPRFELSYYVLAGGHGRALAFGPGWLEGTTLPGGQGRSGISGHRDTHFRFLQHLRTGDRIIIHTLTGTAVEYRVSDRQIQHERAGWILSPDSRQQLVLITCYPFDALSPGGPWRYVVVADVSEPLKLLTRL